MATKRPWNSVRGYIGKVQGRVGKAGLLILLMVGLLLRNTEPVLAAGLTLDFGASTAEQTSTTLQILLMMTVLSIAPAILVLMTSFTRIVIVLSFVRNALGTQQLPPTQVIIGLSLFLTFLLWHPPGTK